MLAPPSPGFQGRLVVPEPAEGVLVRLLGWHRECLALPSLCLADDVAVVLERASQPAALHEGSLVSPKGATAWAYCRPNFRWGAVCSAAEGRTVDNGSKPSINLCCYTVTWFLQGAVTLPEGFFGICESVAFAVSGGSMGVNAIA